MDKREDRADKELELGMYQEFDSVEELIADLHHNPIMVCCWCKLVYCPETATDIHCMGN